MKTTTSDAVRKDQLHAAMEQLETAVREMFESGRFHEYLTMLSRFHNYSFNNILLAWCQNPNISRLASYQTWKKQKMQVRKGEKAIKILCPITGLWKIWKTAQKPELSISRSSVIPLLPKAKSYEKILTIRIIAVAPIGNTWSNRGYHIPLTEPPL